ncbi:MAG: hypothetical protein AABX30_00775 [Nanoarchaeota archaeon]
MDRCSKLISLMKAQKIVIERNLDGHKWMNRIPDRQQAARDFIEKYGWLMREIYCEECSENKPCEVYTNYLEEKRGKISSESL